jgi:hypothetical protein
MPAQNPRSDRLAMWIMNVRGRAMARICFDSLAIPTKMRRATQILPH